MTIAGTAMTIGDLLRHWRAMRGKSQLALSLDAGISQRHLSFIESGRSAPSRGTLTDLAEALDIPLRDRNGLFTSVGFAPPYAEDRWDAPQMKSVTDAVRRMLDQQEPYPAILMDRYWNVLAANAAAPRFFGRFVDLAARPTPRHILHLMFDPAGLRPFISDWERVSRALLARLQREAVGHVLDERSRQLLDALLAYPGGPDAGDAAVDDTPYLPMIPLGFRRGGRTLNYFSIVSTVGTPTTIAAQELRIECMFPADAATERDHRAFVED